MIINTMKCIKPFSACLEDRCAGSRKKDRFCRVRTAQGPHSGKVGSFCALAWKGTGVCGRV